MPIDPDHLMRYEIPVVRQACTEKDCAFYALTLGIGQDPLDRGALKFVGGAGAVVPFPTMPLVLGHPGFWLGRPDTGVDAVRLVHGEQSVEFVRPLSPAAVVEGRTRVVGLVDKGEGRGALLYSEKELTDESGALLAVTRSTTVLRGDGGFGRSTMEPRKPVALPDRDADLNVSAETRPEQALYYRWNGDDNPLHCDPEVARKAGFERPILHGLCTFGIAARVLVGSVFQWEADKLRSIGGRFTAPVFPGDRLAVLIWNEGHFQVRRVGDDKVVLDNGFFHRA